jgi:hypothetical protein
VALLAVSDVVYPLGRKRFGFREAKLSSTINSLPQVVEKYLATLAESKQKR